MNFIWTHRHVYKQWWCSDSDFSDEGPTRSKSKKLVGRGGKAKPMAKTKPKPQEKIDKKTSNNVPGAGKKTKARFLKTAAATP